jgi:hypothetical protein
MQSSHSPVPQKCAGGVFLKELGTVFALSSPNPHFIRMIFSFSIFHGGGYNPTDKSPPSAKLM